MADDTPNLRDQLLRQMPLMECWQCKGMKPCLVSININRDAAGAVPSVMKPLCDDCAPTIMLSA